MILRLLLLLVVTVPLVSLVATSPSIAAPTNPARPVILAVNTNTIAAGSTVQLAGSNFAAGESVSLVIATSDVGSPTSMPPVAQAGMSGLSATADANGAFVEAVALSEPGIATITATGSVSATVASVAVLVSGGLMIADALVPNSAPAVDSASAVGSDGISVSIGGLGVWLAVGAIALLTGLGLVGFGARAALSRQAVDSDSTQSISPFRPVRASNTRTRA